MMYHQWRNYVILDSFLYSRIFRNLLIKSRERKNYVKFFLFVEKLWNFPSFWIFCEISKISKVLKFVKFSRCSIKSSTSYDPWNLANKLSIINKKHDYRFHFFAESWRIVKIIFGPEIKIPKIARKRECYPWMNSTHFYSNSKTLSSQKFPAVFDTGSHHQRSSFFETSNRANRKVPLFQLVHFHQETIACHKCLGQEIPTDR